MKIVSVNVGMPQQVTWEGRTVETGIFKSPVEGPVQLRKHNLQGDGQGDPSVHGGETKAVYVYPAQHYDFWKKELPATDLPWGSFGENLTVEGAEETSICIGDEFQVGSARVVVTEPRMPCFKLGVRFGRGDMVKRFLKSGRSGFYLGVVKEGQLRSGDRLELLQKHPDGLFVADVTRLYTTERQNTRLLKKAISVTALPQSWRQYFAHQLDKLALSGS